jgi:hypothetical protein
VQTSACEQRPKKKKKIVEKKKKKKKILSTGNAMHRIGAQAKEKQLHILAS